MIAHAGFTDHDAVRQMPKIGVGLSDPTAPRPEVDGVARPHSADSGSSGRCAMGT